MLDIILHWISKLWAIFCEFLHQEYPELFYFNSAVDILVDKNKLQQVSITSPCFSYNHTHFKTKRLSVKVGKRVDKLTIFLEDCDIHRLGRSLGAVFTQFGDAIIAYKFCHNMLADQNKSSHSFTNHDCFFCHPTRSLIIFFQLCYKLYFIFLFYVNYQ